MRSNIAKVSCCSADRGIEEERDERLRFLSELRDFKDAHPDEFRRVKHLPLRARCGRKDTTRAGSSLSFIRNERRDAFNRLSGLVEEIGFVEMARAFRAEVAEAAVALHDAHG